METLTRLVAESLARHGFDRPLDYRRLQWSRWFRCESHHSLLLVPSKPGVFALAEEIMDIGTAECVEAAAPTFRRSLTEATGSATDPIPDVPHNGSGGSRKPEAESRRMLAVSQFIEDDDMAFVLDRMLSCENPMRARLSSGRYFVRYVVIEDATQRRSICNALNQWILSSAEKATGIGPHFATSLELPSAEQTHVASATSAVPQARSEAKGSGTGDQNSSATLGDEKRRVNSAPTLNSAVATNIHCSSSFPSGF